MKRRDVRCVQGAVCLVGLVCLFGWDRLGLLKFDRSTDDRGDSAQVVDTWASRVESRHLTGLENCTPRAVEQFPKGLFSQEDRVRGGITIHILVSLYMFLGFAYLCDDYFVPSLEIICDTLQIQSDVAGATFMAAGSSAPELATAIIAVFIAKDDIGLGTVVGSAVYNVMFVISVCALLAGMVVYLNWWPLIRDCVFYSLSVAALSLVILDGNIYWYEALGLVLFYLVYIVIMYYNSKLEAWIVPKVKWCGQAATRKKEPESIVLYDKLRDANSNGAVVLNANSVSESLSDELTALTDSDSDDPGEGHTMKMASYDDEPESVFAWPDAWWKRALYIIAIPLKIVLFISVPDCRKPRWRRWFVVTFIMCLVWLTIFSYIMVWMITVIGYTADIPDTVMGLTFIAFGVSMPDVIASLIVVREGHGDMAVSNAVGSNVFDILICMGVPWLLQIIIKKGEPIEVYSEGLLYSSFTLLATVFLLLLITHLNKWRLTKSYGVVLMIIYVFFTILTSLYELNIFGYVHPKECPSNY
ncbi:sodium/potassium/calcium exchanger 3-like [Pecten maximus]|uniref:sodium/potassium/calcium exchanger 3-like n=1 Tax=Pecten maximus TaxID=6579 RepID=UPI00145811CE|nr:sodium/potassium/calcium exchanger 3-like [Pecten maximus]